MRTLADVGERGLIARIERRVRRAGATGSGAVRLGIGDDAAIVRPRPAEDWVVSHDSTVEGVHFRFANESPTTIGRRALVANLSDLAAMGARPLGFTAALAAPGSLALDRLDGLAAGIARAAARFDCPWIGGNLSRARETSIHIAVFGAVPRGRALRRDAVRAGDRLFVTGTLGDQALARHRAEAGRRRMTRVPEPRLEAGRALARLSWRGGCIDVSDGLASDLRNLLDGTGLGADIESDSIPISKACSAGCRRLGLSSADLAATGGEDYELLFSLRPGAPSAAALSRRLGVPVSEIGRVSRRSGIRGLAAPSGWRHY